MAHFFYLPRIRKENRSSLQRSSVANIHFMREVGDIDYYIGDYKFFIKYLTHENSDIFENFPYDSAYLEICFIFYKDIKELGYDGDIDVNYREMNDYNQKKCSWVWSYDKENKRFIFHISMVWYDNLVFLSYHSFMIQEIKKQKYLDFIL